MYFLSMCTVSGVSSSRYGNLLPTNTLGTYLSSRRGTLACLGAGYLAALLPQVYTFELWFYVWHAHKCYIIYIYKSVQISYIKASACSLGIDTLPTIFFNETYVTHSGERWSPTIWNYECLLNGNWVCMSYFVHKEGYISRSLLSQEVSIPYHL